MIEQWLIDVLGPNVTAVVAFFATLIGSLKLVLMVLRWAEK